jgi:hypothetical protein
MMENGSMESLMALENILIKTIQSILAPLLQEKRLERLLSLQRMVYAMKEKLSKVLNKDLDYKS